jgi:hypothetical protein
MMRPPSLRRRAASFSVKKTPLALVWLVRLSSGVRKVRELPGLSSLHLPLFVFELSSAPSVDETEYSTEM